MSQQDIYDLQHSPLSPVNAKEPIICPDCDGEGKLNVSDCCGAEPSGNGDSDTSDYGICPECHEYCSYGVTCERCSGTGEI